MTRPSSFPTVSVGVEAPPRHEASRPRACQFPPPMTARGVGWRSGSIEKGPKVGLCSHACPSTSRAGRGSSEGSMAARLARDSVGLEFAL